MATGSPELYVQSSSSSDSEFEGSCTPGHLSMSNLHMDTTEAHVREIYFISGYTTEDSEDAIKEQLQTRFNSCGTISKFFFPKDSDTGSYLGFDSFLQFGICLVDVQYQLINFYFPYRFCYFILDVPKEPTTNVAAISQSLMEDYHLHVRRATLKTRVLRAEMA
ncbi:unnamed protein product [Microthlaspi erraticum]|uniref:Uncharacterized protein n=1 Tax=Microthlaspi erraticum TaxID=1685480 RepID=A0A6D2IWE9_9BRAS|nr:unnamed protein product [Microthlaspi erraticum]